MSTSVFQVGLLSAGVIFLIGGAVLAVIASRIASAGKAAQADANVRLAASQELAAEVKRLAEKVELSLQSRDASIENAFLRHNDACAASIQQAYSAKGGHGHHGDDDGDHHKKHHAALSGKGGHHDDDDDDHHHKKHHAMNGERPSLLARLMGRVH